MIVLLLTVLVSLLGRPSNLVNAAWIKSSPSLSNTAVTRRHARDVLGHSCRPGILNGEERRISSCSVMQQQTIRGGSRGRSASSTSTSTSSSLKTHPQQSLDDDSKKTTVSIPSQWSTRLSLAAGLVATYWLYQERSLWTPYLNKQFLQAKTLEILETLRPTSSSTDGSIPFLAWVRALALYSSGMAVWEMAGLSTIPVETAAGMVFGWRLGVLASVTGKITGASMAFALGRTWLAQHVASHDAFAKQPIFQILNDTNNSSSTGNVSNKKQHRHPPLMTAFLMKFSCFPELVKNLGSSMIVAIRSWMFLLATMVHGGSYTMLWTWLGVDTAARMKQPDLPVNIPLRWALGMGMFLGIVVTPLVMAWWIRDLQRGITEETQGDNKQKKSKKSR